MNLDEMVEFEMNEDISTMLELLRQNPNALKQAHKLAMETLEEEGNTPPTQEDIDELEEEFLENMAFIETLIDKAAYVIYSTMCAINHSATLIEEIGLHTLPENEIILAIKHKIIRPIILNEGFCLDLFMRGMHSATPHIGLSGEPDYELFDELVDIGTGKKENPYTVLSKDDPRRDAEYVLSGFGYDSFNGEHPMSDKVTMNKQGNVIQLTFNETGVLN